MDRAFQDAPFVLYGLPEAVPCQRFRAGWARSGDRTTALELGHLSPDGDLNKQLRVNVREAEDFDEDPKFSLGRSLWRQAHMSRARGREDFFSYVEEATNNYGPSSIGWTRLRVGINREPVDFEKAELDDHWVAYVEDRDNVITISGENWPHVDLQLVTIDDVTPYILGSRRRRAEQFRLASARMK